MNTSALTEGQRETLKTQIQQAEDKLQQSSQTVTSHGFNLAISVGFIPAAIILVLVLLISRGSLSTLFIAVILIVIAMAIFASLVAYQSRTRSLQRIFNDEILPEISSLLDEMKISLTDYELLAQEYLPEGSFLPGLLSKQTASESEPSS